jgi:hypothetical protein
MGDAGCAAATSFRAAEACPTRTAASCSEWMTRSARPASSGSGLVCTVMSSAMVPPAMSDSFARSWTPQLRSSQSRANPCGLAMTSVPSEKPTGWVASSQRRCTGDSTSGSTWVRLVRHSASGSVTDRSSTTASPSGPPTGSDCAHAHARTTARDFSDLVIDPTARRDRSGHREGGRASRVPSCAGDDGRP